VEVDDPARPGSADTSGSPCNVGGAVEDVEVDVGAELIDASRVSSTAEFLSEVVDAGHGSGSEVGG
jgi:hypothetical protein